MKLLLFIFIMLGCGVKTPLRSPIVENTPVIPFKYSSKKTSEKKAPLLKEDLSKKETSQ
jgi:hypothetical protein